jgi:hypothetical protein
MTKNALVIGTLVVWLAVALAVAVLVAWPDSSSPPNTVPYKVEQLVTTTGP